MPEDYHANERLWFKGAAENPGTVYITEPYIDAASGNMCFTMSKMLSDNETVVALDFNFSDMQESISRMTSSSDRNALIVTQTGMIIGYKDMSLVGERISKKLPAYEKILERVINSKNNDSFSAEIDGTTQTIFSSETNNCWYMILSADNFALFKDSYRQMLITILVSLLMISVIVIFYLNGVKNRLQTEKALKVKEEFLSKLSQELREPLSRILKLSNIDALETENPAESAAQVRESALKLSDMLDNLFSYSKIISTSDENNNKVQKRVEISKMSHFARIGIIIVLIIAMTLSMILCVNTTINWGDTKMNREADNYNYQLENWIAKHKSILSVFTNIISERPQIMDDYPAAVKFLNDIAKKYPEISVCYMANPYKEHQVIMNNGWEGPEGWHVDKRQWYIDTEKSETGFNISAPYYDDQTGVYCVTVSQVVYGTNGEFLGIFAIDFFLDKLIHILDESYTKNSYAFLVDKNGIIINHPNSDYQMTINKMMNINDTEYNEAYYSNKVETFEDFSDKKIACFAKKNNSSNFTVIVANSWWNIYGNIITLGVVFIILIILSIITVIKLINHLLNMHEKANLELKKSANEAIVAGKAKSQFLAQMSHEIRTPLNAVLGMNELIIRNSKDDEILDYAENIENAGKTLLTLINSILDFSKIEDGKMKIVPVRYDTAILIDDLQNIISERTRKKKLEFEIEVDPNLPRSLYGDDVRIRQIITNLLTNAVKYTHEGTVKLTVSTKMLDSDNLELEVAVIDTGIGIRAEDKEKLFTSFQRLDEENNRNIEGTGLGISIVQKLLKMMNSELEVKSVYGEGSTFSFKLMQKIIDKMPIGDYKDHKKLRNVDKKYLQAKNAKILIVDDNIMNLKVVKGMLKFNGIVPDLAEGGRQCLELAAKTNYDIIFLDHMMPIMDGIETLRELKRSGMVENTKVIALTANAISGAHEYYLKEGFDDYLSKPLHPEELEEILETNLPKELVDYEMEEIDKNEKIDEEVEEISEDNFTSNERKILEKICPSINFDAAMSYCMNSKAFFIEMAQDFYTDDKEEIINKNYAKKDLKNYRIQAHALKSTSLIIGALKFSEFAKNLEIAAKEEDFGYMKENHEKLMKNYKKLREEIGEWLKINGNR